MKCGFAANEKENKVLEVKILDGKKEFMVVVDTDSIINSIRNMKNDYGDEEYVWYGTSPEFGEDDFEYISKQEFNDNVDKFMEDFLSYTTEEKLKDIISTFPRKKNGTFNRRNVKELASCENCIVIHEWHNTWIYYVIKVAAWDDTTLKVELFKKTDTPG